MISWPSPASNKHRGITALPANNVSLGFNSWLLVSFYCDFVTSSLRSVNQVFSYQGSSMFAMILIIELNISEAPNVLVLDSMFLYTSLILVVDHSPVTVICVTSLRDGMQVIIRAPSWWLSSSDTGSMRRFFPIHDCASTFEMVK